MSHTTTLKSIAIKDIDALQSAAAEMQEAGVNCSLVANAKPRMYYANQHGNCAYVLKLEDAPYDVGFEAQEDGSYAPVFDEWQNRVHNQIGASCPMPDSPEGRTQRQIGRFLQSYAKHAAINSACASGYMVESTSTDAEGNVHLHIAV